MNERIQQLAEQAKKHALDAMIKITNKEQALKVYSESYDTEFAELIVKECINEIAYIGKANEVFGDRTDRGGLNHILWTTETAIEKIKQHFGVEPDVNENLRNRSTYFGNDI
jgi:hypothetical protein